MDPLDYLTFYLAALLIAVLKITGFVAWPWWTVGIPLALALILFIIALIANR